MNYVVKILLLIWDEVRQHQFLIHRYAFSEPKKQCSDQNIKRTNPVTNHESINELAFQGPGVFPLENKKIISFSKVYHLDWLKQLGHLTGNPVY